MHMVICGKILGRVHRFRLSKNFKLSVEKKVAFLGMGGGGCFLQNVLVHYKSLSIIRFLTVNWQNNFHHGKLLP